MEKYIIQKTQKITSALYLITDLIKDSDAIKWEIREEGISLVSSALMFNTSVPVEKEHAFRLFLLSSEKIISFLNISLISSLISDMNSSIVIHEIESLINFINKEDKNTSLPGYILSDTFFATDLPDGGLVVEKKDKDIKGQKISSRTIGAGDERSVGSSKAGDRKASIINMLKKDSSLTIKDFAKVIKGCSEKTIQRELITLVKQGIVKRLGERRWSTYSLVIN